MVTRKAPVKKAAAEKGPAKKTAKPAMAARRDDFGALANVYVAKQPADNTVLLEKLRGHCRERDPRRGCVDQVGRADASAEWQERVRARVLQGQRRSQISGPSRMRT